MNGGRRRTQGCALDMTPMIDVVFQLIIFFVVSINLADRSNPDIQLEKGLNGEQILNKSSDGTLTVEIDRRGRTTISNIPLTHDSLRQIVQARFIRLGQYPLLIRGDLRTRHDDIRKVMDMCTAVGLHRVWFAAIKEERSGG